MPSASPRGWLEQPSTGLPASAPTARPRQPAEWRYEFCHIISLFEALQWLPISLSVKVRALTTSQPTRQPPGGETAGANPLSGVGGRAVEEGDSGGWQRGGGGSVCHSSPLINNAEEESTSFLFWAPVNADKTPNFKCHYSPEVCFLLNTDKREGAERAHVAGGAPAGPPCAQLDLEVQCRPSDTCLITPSVCDRVPVPGTEPQV